MKTQGDVPTVYVIERDAGCYSSAHIAATETTDELKVGGNDVCMLYYLSGFVPQINLFVSISVSTSRLRPYFLRVRTHS
jgi:hypothetical protein